MDNLYFLVIYAYYVSKEREKAGEFKNNKTKQTGFWCINTN